MAPEDERLVEAERLAVEYARRSEEQMTRWARRGKDQPAASDRPGEARLRAGVAVQERIAQDLASVRARAVETQDDMPF